MDYIASCERILSVFHRQGFLRRAMRGHWHSAECCVDILPNRTEVLVVFPGLKTTLTGEKVKAYDYRVDIRKAALRTALSHANIIVDIYAKCAEAPSLIGDMKTFLGNLFREDSDSPYENIASLKDYIPKAPPSARILEQARVAHARERKSYNEVGNRFSYSIPELASVIKWIALQEDINYPMSQGYEGRRMPFSRYLEAVHQAERGLSVCVVVRRALKHTRPRPLRSVDYSCIRELNR